MRVVVTAMGGPVPELFLLTRELSRRFDRISLLLGPDVVPMRSPCAVDGVDLGHWIPTQPSRALDRALDGADAVVHVPPRSDQEHRCPPMVTQRSIACVAEALSRSNGKRRSFVSLVRADEGDRTAIAPGPILTDPNVRTCIARFGVILRAPTGPLGRMLCAFRTQGASARADCRRSVRWIHVLDAVRAVAHVLTDPSLSGRLELIAPEAVSVDSFASAVWSAYGLPHGLRGPAAGFGRFLSAPLLDSGAPDTTIKPQRLIDSGFSYLFPDLASALEDIAQPDRN